MTMKNLTHYFKSPKEEDRNPTVLSELSVETVQEKAPPKKRKISLSKSKKNKKESSEGGNSSNETVQNNLEVSETKNHSAGNLTGKRNKKRKLEDDSKSPSKKIKSSKLSNNKVKKKHTNCKVNQISNPQTTLCESNVKLTQQIIHEKEDNTIVILENSLSCDEPIIRTNRKLKKNLFIDSDDEASATESQPPLSAGKLESNDNISNPPSRSSLFSYFNKVDKETALKQQKSEKIEVKAIVHYPPSKTKIGRQSVGKMKKSINKSPLDDSDCIELISSEEIVDENNSTHVNVPSAADQSKIISSSVNVDNLQNTPTHTYLASIFIPKKIGQQSKPVKDVSPTISGKEILSVEETREIQNGKETIPSKEKKLISKKNKEVNTSKGLQRMAKPLKKKSNDDSEVHSSSKVISQQEERQEESLVDENTSLKMNKLPNKFLTKDVVEKCNSRSSSSLIAETNSATEESPVINKTKKLKSLQIKTPDSKNKNNLKNLEGKTPDSRNKNNLKNLEGKTLDSKNKNNLKNLEVKTPDSKKKSDLKNLEGIPPDPKNKSNWQNIEVKTPDLKICDDGKKTPNKKAMTINGYFMKKSDNLTNTGINGSEKCVTKSKSPWVMKVCLSASKTKIVDSDEDECQDSQDSGKGESETVSISQEEECDVNIQDTTPPVVVIDDEDEDDLSTKIVESNNSGVRKSLPRNAKNCKPNILEGEKEIEEKTKEVKPQTPKQPVKMWPFFQKGSARQVKESPVDEAKLKAKMLFLESGVPESIKRKVETVRSETTLGDPAPFPSVSHVMQADDQMTEDMVSMKLGLPPARAASPPPAMPPWTSVLPMDPPTELESPVFERAVNLKAFLKKVEEEEQKPEVKSLYKKLKEYKSKAESDIWTEVYKPTSSADMVGNTEHIKQLKTWLETLKNCRKREGSESSGDEFVTEDSDGEENSFNNMAVISGPCGCGKTSAVYAIAKELDIKVLEINASCNRSGKRILAEFSESTQSHHVERSQPINGLFNNQGSGKKKRKKHKIPDKLKSEKTSLILVEDADLLFADCDEGFVPALASLSASSKRPIVLITNQDNTPHLDRFNNAKLLRITFKRPRPNKLSLWLRLVGLVEGVMMPSDLALRLVTARKCDVRRCLMDLQLMVHSNNSEVRDVVSVSRLWWGWPGRHLLSYELPTILEQEEEQTPPPVDKRLIRSQLLSVAETSRRLARLDVLSLASREDCLEEEDDPCPVAWTVKWRDSTALTVCAADDAHACDEAAWLLQALATDMGADDRTSQSPQEARWLAILRQGEQLFMSGITTTVHTNHQSVACDYLPTLRDLGRSEQVRLANYTRRANRFFNYLQGLGIHASKSYRDFMCDAFS